MINWSVEDNKIIYFEEPSFKFYEMLEDEIYKLNDEVEIVEEQQDIDIQAIEELDEEIAYTNLDLATSWSASEKKIVKQQNQILKYLKQLDRREER